MCEKKGTHDKAVPSLLVFGAYGREQLLLSPPILHG